MRPRRVRGRKRSNSQPRPNFIELRIESTNAHTRESAKKSGIGMRFSFANLLCSCHRSSALACARLFVTVPCRRRKRSRVEVRAGERDARNSVCLVPRHSISRPAQGCNVMFCCGKRAACRAVSPSPRDVRRAVGQQQRAERTTAPLDRMVSER